MLPLKTEEDRSKSDGVKLQVWGGSKLGKTFLAKSLPPQETLFLDAEKGMLSLQGWPGKSIDILDWPSTRDLTCYIAGPSKSATEGKKYSLQHYQHVAKRYGDRKQLEQFRYLFIDSTTLIGKYCFTWAESQPDSFTASGAKNLLGTFGLLGRELIDWAWRLQAIKGMDVILVGGIKPNDDGTFDPLLDGSSANKLQYVFDEIVTLALIENKEGEKVRALICHPDNEHGYPAGDRSGKLSMYEKPDLFALIKKIKGA